MITKYIESTYSKERVHVSLLFMAIGIYIWSFIDCYGYFEWFMLSLPAVLMLIGFVLTYKYFQFSTISYVIVLIHVFVLLFGAKHTYTYNPWFNQLMDVFGWSRNHFDRVGHFFQGFTPGFMFPELLIAFSVIKKNKFIGWITIAFCLAISATWELLEFIATLIINNGADYVINTQGDIWDSEWDMIIAIIGASIAYQLYRKLLGSSKII
jgi:putative membrane protein